MFDMLNDTQNSPSCWFNVVPSLTLPNRHQRYELRNNPDFAVQIVKSLHKGLECLSYLGPKIWELLPLEIKETVESPKLKQRKH